MARKIIITTFFLFFGLAVSSVFAAPQYNIFRTLLPEADNLYDLGTSTARVTQYPFYDKGVQVGIPAQIWGRSIFPIAKEPWF